MCDGHINVTGYFPPIPPSTAKQLIYIIEILETLKPDDRDRVLSALGTFYGFDVQTS